MELRVIEKPVAHPDRRFISRARSTLLAARASPPIISLYYERNRVASSPHPSSLLLTDTHPLARAGIRKMRKSPGGKGKGRERADAGAEVSRCKEKRETGMKRSARALAREGG